MTSFYHCSEPQCNKKYKKEKNLIKHLLNVHQNINPINQESSKKSEIDLIHMKKNISNVNTQSEIQNAELYLLAIKEAEKQIKNAIEKRLNNDKVKLNVNAINKPTLIKDSINVKTSICCICFNAPANTATIPCGHKMFCYECIEKHIISSQDKLCPICRSDIITITEIFS